MTLPAPSDTLRLGRRTFAPGELAVMAIINRTPDSFYDNGATFDLEPALDRLAQRLSKIV